MKVYISGPITGTSDYMERFAEAEKELAAAGFVVVNPARVNAELPAECTHSEYMETSIAMESFCDAVYFLEGWEESKGCEIEFEYAFEKKKLIFFENGKVAAEQINPFAEWINKRFEIV